MSVSKKILLNGMLASVVSISSMNAIAETTGYDQLSFSTEAKEEVENDEVQASMYKKVQEKSAKVLATKLNMAMNKAIKIAKKYPSVTVSSGQHNTYPNYNKKNKIIGWSGQANLNIKSTDLESASQLIAELQDSLVLDNLNFGVSEKRKDKLEKELLMKVSKNFQQQAQTLTSAWGATSYRIVKVDLNTGSNYHYRPMRATAKFSTMEQSATAPTFAAGNSSISVSANGSIELVR